MNAGQVIREAKRQLTELTGLAAETVSSLERDGDEAWVVTVEALELSRVPETMDLIGSYEVTLSDDGELLAFHRRRRYQRAAAEEGGG